MNQILLASLVATTLFGFQCGQEAVPGASATDVATDDPRAAAAGLDDSQAAELMAYGYPVVVPTDLGEFELSEVQHGSEFGFHYLLDYRSEDGACFIVTGVTDGLGGPGFPEEAAPAPAPHLGLPIQLNLYVADDTPGSDEAETWGPGALMSDYMAVDGVYTTFRSGYDNCRPPSLAEGQRLMASLRYLNPADDDHRGPFEAVDLDARGGDEWYARAGDPEEIAEDMFGYIEDTGEGNTRVEVETIRETPGRVAVLVSVLDQLDDSVRDSRTRVVFHPAQQATGWTPVAAGRQWRCRPDRGSQEWGTELCL
ncbi:hypothetical protein BH23BAC4_BH23BAC4_17170 [soil metagenome]